MKKTLKKQRKKLKLTTLGFTLVELIATIIILCSIFLIVTPLVVNIIRDSEDEVSEATTELLESAAELYLSENKNVYPQTLIIGSTIDINLQTLVDAGILTDPIKDINTKEDIDLKSVVRVTVLNNLLLEYEYIGIVEDKTKPIINISTPIVQIETGEDINLLDGVLATDNVDGDITFSTIYSPSSIDTNVPGEYIINYNVRDSSGNSTTATKTIKVVKKYMLTNLVTNPSFEDGNRYWTLSKNVSVTSEKFKFGTSSIRNNGGQQYNAAYKSTNKMSAEPNHQYYFSTWSYTANKGSGSCYSAYSYYYDNTEHWFNPNGTYQSNVNVWEHMGWIITSPSVSSQINIVVADYNRTDALQDCYADGVMVIDLTEAFGAGNEPSLEWCNENIDFFETTTFVYK